VGEYKSLKKQIFISEQYSLVPLRMEDRYRIMKWRNEQIYHLRQSKPLTEKDQENYFESVVSSLFEQEKPNQILFSLLKNNECIGYGGLVHINWIDQHAEVSFIMDTSLEKNQFEKLWTVFLYLLEDVAFHELKFHKLNTYAFDVRPHLYKVLEDNLFIEEARLKEHCYYKGQFIDVLLQGKINEDLKLQKATTEDLELTFNWAKNPIIRKYAFQQNEIQFDEHKVWFMKQLADENTIYFILRKNKMALGSIRINKDGQGIGLISYHVDPKYHGNNLGSKMLKLAIREIRINNPEIMRIIGYVMPENLASIKIFEKLNFNLFESTNNHLGFELFLNQWV
jgi:RimJ/RimL family protein N-acetyltransferase